MEKESKSMDDIITKLKAGDRKAFDDVYNVYWSKLFRTALAIVDEEDGAKDIIQDVFISFWEKVGATNIINLEAYLVQSVKYRCFMHLRSGKISERHIQRIEKIIATNTTEEEFFAGELQSLLDTRMASLPEKCKEVFYLSRFESLSNKKIAERLSISPKTVENQITKALRVLRLSVDKLAVVIALTLF